MAWFFRCTIGSLISSSISPILDDWVPKIDIEFDSRDQAWKFWVEYGGKMGFGVRKDYSNKSRKDEIVTFEKFVCNKEGFREIDKRDHLSKAPRAETRTGCLVGMKIIFDRKKYKYHLSDFNGEHNHDLHAPICVHLLRSQRNIIESQAIEVDLAYDVGLTQKKAFDLFGVKSGGREHVGFLPLDQKNYLRTKRERGLQFGEVGSLLMSFKNQASQDPSFFNAFQLDNEEQITNIFWADGRMRMDYELFGYIVTFDTTFATNKDHRPLGVFIGFNHYTEQVIFGASLLYDETQASFDWVFNTFLEAHKFKKPITLFNDQDIAMGNAVRVVMPELQYCRPVVKAKAES
ncbi:hypothetical protein RJ639_034784 [Escallonia herrerae]|uniref:Protein FAR1-RELATED SEQUENCE n=1 Tax=Escallonia herrerae TaxID=1293975 RepID=A0AA89B9Y7_9ASTE|nr:hypothetical protein RJ639_034784 [Escallonia herrerae]